MDTFLLRVFQRQIATQCFAAMTAAQQAQVSMGNSQDMFWAQIQACLTAVANISKALYGQGGKYEKEREPLRASLGITEPNSLRATTMRNHLDHFDERLDEWYATSVQHNYLDYMIGPPNMVAGVADIDMFRVFDPTTGDIVFWGKQYPLRAIMDEVAQLYPIAQAEADKPHWDPPAPPSTSGSGQ